MLAKTLPQRSPLVGTAPHAASVGLPTSPPLPRRGGGALSRCVPALFFSANARETCNKPIIKALCGHVVEADADGCQDYENVLLRP